MRGAPPYLHEIDARRDAAASALIGRPCPLCRAPLELDRPTYGWGSMGAGAKCPRCGLRLRAAWQSLFRAIIRAAALRKAAR
jgi:endogenous inhibitor of DNA gyrase (YacG/DUF329 family)